MTPDPNCDICFGEGKVDVDEITESGIEKGVGSKRCLCTLSDERNEI